MKSARPNSWGLEELKQSQIYRSAGKIYHDDLLGTAIRIEYKAICLTQKFNRSTPGRTVLFYPDRPAYSHTLYKVCNILGCVITSSIKIHPDLVVAFEDVTKRENSPVLNDLAAHHFVVNRHCGDISKVKVEKVFREVFGYETFVDPERYQGLCVLKSDENGMHDGEVIDCPTNTRRRDVVYQKMINNAVGNKVMDIRVPTIKDQIPFVYLKYRRLSSRFSNVNASVTIAAADSVLADHELTSLLEFANRFGLDYGELDVLRDSDDGRIYVIDVNNTPDGPPNHLSKAEGKRAMRMLSNSFRAKFLERYTS
jgi:hypothetical protein